MKKFLRTLMLAAAMILPLASHAQSDCTGLTLPYAENFDAYTGNATSTTAPTGYPSITLPDCWSFLNMSESTSTYPQAFLTSNTSYAVSGNCLFFKSSSSTPLYAILPSFGAQSGHWQLSFTYRNEGVTAANGTIIVGVMSDPTDATSFVAIETLERTTTKTPVEILIPAGSVTTNGRVAICYQGGTNNNYYASIDDLTLNVAPSCLRVSNLAVNAATANSVTLSWTDTMNTGAHYSVFNMAAVNPQVIATWLSGTTYTVTGLDANTAYEFGVSANCSDTDASAIMTISCRTDCGTVQALPYVEEFNGYTGFLAYPYYGPSTTPACWLYYSNGTNTAETNSTTAYYGGVACYNGTSYGSMESNNPYLYLPIQLTGSAVTSSTALDYDEARGNVRIAAMPPFAEALTSLQVSFDYKMGTAYSATGAAATLEFGYVYGEDITFVSMQSYQAVTTTQHVVDLNLSTLAVGAPAGSRLAFKFSGVHNGTSTSSYSNVACGIDNIVVTSLPTCLRATNLAASNITSHAVTLTWADTLNTGATYTVYDMADTTVIATGITAMTYTVTGLDANTDYVFGVVANCSATDASAITSISARTACEAEDLPFIEDFSTTLANNPCWNGSSTLYTAGVTPTLGAITGWSYQSSTNNGLPAGHYRVNIYGTSCKYWLVTPEFDFTTATSPLLSFDAAFTVYTSTSSDPANTSNIADDKFMVFASTDGGTTWNTAYNFDLTTLASSTYQTQYVDLSAFAGETVRLAFYAESTVSGGDNNLHIDNISVSESTGDICNAPTNLTISGVTETGATLTWVGTATSYNVYTVTSTDTTLYQNVTDTAIVFTGLTAMTNYSYGVTSVCGSDESPMVIVSFRTACSAITLPFTENFEATSNTLGCWSTEGSGNWTVGTGDYSTSTGAFEGATNAKINHGTTGNATKLISPVLDNVTDGVQLTYAHIQRAWSGDQDELRVYYRAGADSAWQQVAEYTTEVSTWTVDNVIIPGEVYQIAFEMTDGYGYGVALDSVVINAAPNCMPVTDLAVDSVTATSVFLSWTGNASSYSIYSSTGAVVATGITTTSYEVTGLTPSTSYTFGVIANCGSDNSEAVIISAVTECGGTTCFVEINGTDSYGDGWNGNAINLIQNGAVIHTFTLTSGSTLSEHITVCGDFPVNFAWVAGSYADEVFFELKDASGMVVYTCNDATALTDDTVFYTLTTVCPSCAAPVITVDNATETSITINWTGNAASYDVYNGSTYVASVTTNTYTFTGLSTATTYTFGVQAICSTTDSSAINSITVMTSCGDITTLPYFEGFENGLGCWTTVNGSSDGQPWSVNNCAGLSTVDPHGGNYVASSWSWSSSAMHADAWLISPKFILPSNVTDSLMFSWWEIANPSYPDSYSVLISTSTSDTSAFTVIRPSTAAAGTWTMQSIDLTSYAGQSVYVAFHHVDYDENYLLIDDITMSLGGAPVITDSAHITIAVNDPTMGTTIPAPGTYAYADGEEFTITAVPANGYQLLDWAVTVTYDGETETEYLGTTDLTISDTAYAYFDMLNLVVTAIFGTDSIDPNADSMLVNIAVNDPTMGTTNPAPGAHYFHVGEQASVVAIPNTGYHLEGWTVNVTIEGVGTVMDTTLPYAINDFFDLWGGWEVEEGDGMYTWNVTANFAAGAAPETNDSLTVITSVNNAAWGTVTPAPGTHYYTEGQTFTMGAAPNEGYYIYAVYTTVTMPGFGTISDTAYAEDLEIEMGQPLYEEVEVDEDMIGMVMDIHVVFASLQGIENAEEVNVNVYGNEGDIVLQGAEGREVYVFDVNGRMLHHTATANMTERYSVPATGVYLVKVEGVVTKRVVIVR